MRTSKFDRWRYAAPGQARDLRLDWLRGYCIVVMIIDHVGLFPAWTIGLTGGIRLWVSAAEGFLLIAGIVMGMLYPRWIAERGSQWTIRHVLRRAAALYALTVVGQIILNTGDFVLRLTRGRPTDVPTNYFELIKEAILQTRYAPAHLALLPLFTLVLIWGLVVLYALSRGHWRWVLLGSIGLWYIGRLLSPAAFPFLRTPFRFTIWQLLFTIGLFAGYYRAALRQWWTRLPWRPIRLVLLIGSAVGLLLLSYQVSFNGLWAQVDWLKADSLIFLRTQLGPGRVIAAVWVFAAGYELLSLCWRPLQRVLGWLMLPLGQHALTAFLFHSVTVYCVERLPGWPFIDHDPTVMGFIHVAIVLAIWGAALATVYVRTHWTRAQLMQARVLSQVE
jgi:hypothetical protein